MFCIEPQEWKTTEKSIKRCNWSFFWDFDGINEHQDFWEDDIDQTGNDCIENSIQWYYSEQPTSEWKGNWKQTEQPDSRWNTSDSY